MTSSWYTHVPIWARLTSAASGTFRARAAIAAAKALLAADSPWKIPSATSTGCHAPAGPGIHTRLAVYRLQKRDQRRGVLEQRCERCLALGGTIRI
eukprot:7062647-Alexandrium_andersonii.AAC.1